MKILETILLYLLCLVVLAVILLGKHIDGNGLSIAFISTIALILINRLIINTRKA